VRVALVTGTSTGIGFATALHLARHGHRVVATMRNLGKAGPLEEAAGAERLPLTVRELDVTRQDSIDRAVAATRETEGAIDVLVNNAGVHYDEWQYALNADWHIVGEAFATNLFGAWRCAQCFAPAMRDAGWGRIVNVSSEAGSLAEMGAGTPAYATSKAALNALTRVLAGELGGSGVLVNAVCPGWTATDMGGGGRAVAEGAAGIVWAATLPDDGPTGGFFRDGRRLRW
jgi:NAD(P)-dependent dehydrogenase (short-subunit alcohol dehydrogenase family)